MVLAAVGALALNESIPFLVLNVCCQFFLLIWYKCILNRHKTNDDQTEEVGQLDKHFEEVAKEREAIGLVYKRAEAYGLIEVAHRPSLRTNEQNDNNFVQANNQNDD